jgi:flagellar basal-body rod modification protein FlgD
MSDISSVLGTGAGVANPLGSAGTIANAAGGAMGKDQFLKLLIAQMQNQDPLNPMDGMQFASQLAQFSSVEQLQQLNSKLDEEANNQLSMLSAVNGSVAVSTFGREIVAVGNQLDVDGVKSPEAMFDSPVGGGMAKIHIYNAAGREVATVDAGKVSDGVQTVDLSSATKKLPEGTYTYDVDITDEAGEVTNPTTYMQGRVDGIHYTPDGPVLTAGGLSIPFGAILKILSAD